jgi:hypothetical protein
MARTWRGELATFEMTDASICKHMERHSITTEIPRRAWIVSGLQQSISKTTHIERIFVFSDSHDRDFAPQRMSDAGGRFSAITN